jgi:hypothetical protein
LNHCVIGSFDHWVIELFGRVIMSSMTKEQKQFLSRRLSAATEKQPELIDLKKLLLRLGGGFLVAPPKHDPDVSRLLTVGFVMRGVVNLRIMARNSCHQNVAAIWKEKKLDIVGIATGYALSRDGLWRQHSWGVLRDGLLETTEKRTKYFGILLQGSLADRFVRQNP